MHICKNIMEALIIEYEYTDLPASKFLTKKLNTAFVMYLSDKIMDF